MTVLHRGAYPNWSDSAWGQTSAAPTFVPYVLADHGNALGVLFAYPLRARRRNEKILWVMRLPRNYSELVIHARPLHRAGPIVSVTLPADSGPGRIYPSYVDVPSAGCWNVTLRWEGHTDSVDLAYG